MKHYETKKKIDRVAKFTKAKMADKRPVRYNLCDENLDIWIGNANRWDTFGLLDKLPLTAVNRFSLRKTLKRYYVAVDEILQAECVLATAPTKDVEQRRKWVIRRNVATCNAHIYKNTFVDYFDCGKNIRAKHKELLDTIFGVDNWHWRTELSNL